jgi:hypothetical protein
MEPVLIGYMPKQTKVPNDFGAPHLESICSASTCIAKGPPDGWVDFWLHNEHWLFQSPATARTVLASADASEFTIQAYRMFPWEFDQGSMQPQIVNDAPAPLTPNGESLILLPPNFRFLGFDVVEKSPIVSGFSCSPLSCNGAWSLFETNKHCLIDNLPRAIDLATIFSKGDWEPGPYRVVEVFQEAAA